MCHFYQTKVTKQKLFQNWYKQFTICIVVFKKSPAKIVLVYPCPQQTLSSGLFSACPSLSHFVEQKELITPYTLCTHYIPSLLHSLAIIFPMASRDPEIEEGGGGGSLKKPLLHTGSWYRMAGMSSRQSSMFASSAQILRESVSIFLCVFIVALGPIQFGFTVISPALSMYNQKLKMCMFSDLRVFVFSYSVGIQILRRQTS